MYDKLRDFWLDHPPVQRFVTGFAIATGAYALGYIIGTLVERAECGCYDP